MGEKNKSIKAKTTEMSPEALEAIREAEESGKTFKPKKMEPDKPVSGKGKKDIKSLIKNAKSGGMNAVPSKYEGFSKLPETVQEKISPKLAGKYKTGGMSKAVMKARGGTFKGTF